MNKLFQHTAGLRPSRSVFDLSYSKKFTGDMGNLYPVVCDEMYPGDTFQIANEIVIRMQPLVAPIMHAINAYVHYFFIPYRLLWDGWEEFITGGVDGESALTPPRWDPTVYTLYSLWDYMGFPVGVKPTGRLPLDFPRRAYNFVFNEFYRDENLSDEVGLDNEAILRRAWEKDYFTSALPWQQRGIAPALPISGLTSAEWVGGSFVADNVANYIPGGFRNDIVSPTMRQDGAQAINNNIAFFNNNVVDLSSATTFNVADLRLAFQIQKWMERNARTGARYIESLKAHFNVNPRDDRLQRPEYIGGMKTPIVISEVLQTSATDSTSPQGNLAGHGITADRGYVANYTALEHGLILGLFSLMPKVEYNAQGINRQWLRETRYDFYWPEFANLSEQAIERVEIFASEVEAENKTVFGFQGRFDEMRYKPSLTVAGMRSLFDYWHLNRIFSTYPELNEQFITCNPSKRIFAVQDEPGFIITVGNLIKGIRPMPFMSNPGLIDHN